MKPQIQKFPWKYAGLMVVVSFRVMKVLTPGNSVEGGRKMFVIIHDSHRATQVVNEVAGEGYFYGYYCEKCGADSSTKLGRNKLKEKCKVKK